MRKVRFVNELPLETIKGLREQLIRIGFDEADFLEFRYQRITDVEDTLQDTTYYVLRDSDNKPFTIADNRSRSATDYLVVEYINRGNELHEEVIDIRETKDTDELIVTTNWNEGQTTKEFIDLESVRRYYYIDNPNYV